MKKKIILFAVIMKVFTLAYVIPVMATDPQVIVDDDYLHPSCDK